MTIGIAALPDLQGPLIEGRMFLARQRQADMYSNTTAMGQTGG